MNIEKFEIVNNYLLTTPNINKKYWFLSKKKKKKASEASVDLTYNCFSSTFVSFFSTV